MEAFTRDQDQVERAVEFAVAATVEPVADGLAGGGRDRGGAGEACEGRFRSELTNDRLYLACGLAALLMNENIDPARQRSTRRSSQP
jgi:hypothetical protein